MKTFLSTLLASATLLATSPAFATGTPSLTGQWTVHNSISGSESDQVCKFVQTDDKLAGTCKSEDKEVKITGSLDGKKVTWKYDSDYNGTPLTLTYTATLEDAEKITGSVEVAPFGVTGDFTATPAKEAGK